MGKYARLLAVDAEQIEFSEADKAQAKKGIPVATYGSDIKYEDGVFSVLIHLGDDAKQVKEGDWVVTEEGGRKVVVSADEFPELYQEYEEKDLAELPPSEDAETELPPETEVKKLLAPPVEDKTGSELVQKEKPE